MDFTIEFTDRAVRDLNSVAEYYCDINNQTAKEVLVALTQHIRILVKMPLIGTGLQNRTAVYKLYHSPFAVYYRIDRKQNTVSILHVWQGVRKRRAPTAAAITALSPDAQKLEKNDEAPAKESAESPPAEPTMESTSEGTSEGTAEVTSPVPAPVPEPVSV